MNRMPEIGLEEDDDSPSRRQAFGPHHHHHHEGEKEEEEEMSEESNSGDVLQIFRQTVAESQSDGAVAPPCGEDASCGCLQDRQVDRKVDAVELHLHFLLKQADRLYQGLINGHGQPDREVLVAAVLKFLNSCQPYFFSLESTARSTASQHLPMEACTRLLDFSQQLSLKVEHLLLYFASYNLLSLDETDPHSVSHFFIGRSQLNQLRITTFRYCKLTPYLAQVDTGIYKRMRWNVDRLRDNQQQLQQQPQGQSLHGETETVGDTEYYFLCCEDIHSVQAAANVTGQGASDGNVMKMWSIGQWVQVNPDPNTETIYDWILCEVPQAHYHRLLFLGKDEPSSCSATDYFQQLLLTHQSAH